MNKLTKLVNWLLNSSKNKVRRNIFVSMASVVVFVTTYALILPAITQSGQTYCGLEEHKHTDACYTVEKTLTCGQEESDGHKHSDSCYKTVKELICSEEESNGHVHTDACYTEEQVLTCTNTDPDHVHDESCYTSEKKLTCGMTEGEGAHHHTDECYKETKELICGKTEGQGAHKHTDACYSEEKVLTCTKEEHTHSTSCYANPDADTENAKSWSNTFKEAKLTGDWSEDVITIAKTQLGYKESTKNYVLDSKGRKKGYTRYGAWYGNEYGDWCAMFCSFCINYAEIPTSEKSAAKVQATVNEEGTEEDSVTYMPIGAGCQAWIEKLNSKETPYYYAVNDENSYDLINGEDSVCFNDPEQELEAWKEEHEDDGTDIENASITDVCTKYHPQAGDLIFFNWDNEVDSDHVGLVESVEYDKDGSVKLIHTIEGNSSNAVKENKYKPDDEKIMGFARMPENPNPEPTEKEIAAEVTEADIAEDSAVMSEDEADEISGDIVTAETEAEAESETAESETDENATAEETDENATEETSESVIGEDVEINELQDDDHEFVQTVEGKDYTVTVSYGSSANIPEDAELKAEEYKKSSATYKKRYQEAAELYNWDSDHTDTFRLFNIGFYVDGEEIEPAANVNVTITYSDSNLPDGTNYQVTHYTDDKPVTMDASTSTENGDTVIDFKSDGFSDYSTSDAVGAASSDKNLISQIDFTNNSISDSTGNALVTAYGDTCFSTQTVNALYTGAGASLKTMSYDMTGKTYRGYTSYLALTNQSQESLLSGYDQVSFDFYMRAESKTSTTYYGNTMKANYVTDTTNGWLVYVGADSTTHSASTGSYLGVYMNSAATSLTAVSYVDGNKKGEVTISLTAGSKYHVLAEFTSTQIVLKLWVGGTAQGSQTAECSYDIASILGSGSILQFCKGNIDSTISYLGSTYTGEYYSGYIDAIKVFAANSTGSSTTPTEDTETADGYPDCALPGTISINHQLFYSIDASGDSVQGVKNVEYKLYQKQSDGTWKTVKTITTTSDMQNDLGSLPVGEYKIEQVSVPEGYTLNHEVKTFKVEDGVYTNIGIFYLYKETDNTSAEEKTAQVVDYVNRIYQVDLGAYSSAYTYNFDVKDYFVVVDQSNSMLFPAELTDTGKTVKLYGISGTASATNRADANETNMENAGLDTNQVYYIIADETVTSTVYALYYDKTNKGWCYQDAAYYAKAQFNARGIYSNLAKEKDGDGNYFTVGYAKSTCYNYSGTDDNGATYHTGGNGIKWLASTLNGDATTQGKTYTIYTGSTYDRLHEVQEAVSLFAEQLAAITPTSTLTIETFDMNVETCTTHSLDPAGIKEIIGTVNTMATAGGTRQDRALAHLLGTNTDGRNNSGCTKTHLSAKNDDIVILITDGAPVTSSADNKTGDTASIAKVTTAGNNVTATGATLITVGLSTQNVTGGSGMLKDIASSTAYTDSGKWFFDSTQSGQLTKILVENVLFKLGTKTAISENANIKDVISDSFYPVDENGNALTSGTRIALDGTVDSSGPGTVLYDSANEEWYVEWDNQALGNGTTTGGTTTTTDTTYTWTSSGTTLDTSQTYWISKSYAILATGDQPTSNISSGANIAAVTYSSSTNKWTAVWYRWSSYSKIYKSDSVDTTGLLTDVTSYVTETLGTTTTTGGTTGKWTGRIYLKAKEDFIGGNTIDTNKSATITFLKSDGTTDTSKNPVSLETPTVNVRLLPYAGFESEETVFLGDEVSNIQDKLQALFNKTVFQKIVSGTGTVLNYKTDSTAENGCKADTFSIPYAIQQHSDTAWSFSSEQWEALWNGGEGGTINIEYTYDDESSHGAVGYFTFQLTKEVVDGETEANGNVSHITSKTGKDVEKYTLSVTYTAYRIGQADSSENVREENVHNGTGSPGTEVGSVSANEGETIEEGLKRGVGSETVNEVHHVHVIDGKIYLKKTIEDNLVDTKNDQTFTFNIYLTDPGDGLPTEYYTQATITIKAGQTSGTVCIDHLPRNTYYVKELSGAYITKDAAVIATYTNCSNAVAYEIHKVTKSDTRTITLTKTVDQTSTKDRTYNLNVYLADPGDSLPTEYYTQATITIKAGDTSGKVEIPYKEGVSTYYVKDADGFDTSDVTVYETGDTNSSTNDYVLKYDIGTNPASTEGKNPDYNVIIYNDNVFAEEEESVWDTGVMRYVYSEPFTTISADAYSDSAGTGYHTEYVDTETYAWSSGQIISTDTTGDKYTALTGTAAALEAVHTNYGVLTQSDSDKDKWTVTWHTFTASGTTTTYDWEDGTIISTDTSGSQYVKLDKTATELDAAHTSYGVLNKDSSGNWTITWHIWSSNDETTTTYTMKSGTIISTDTSGQYVALSDSAATLDAAHTSYGILNQDSSGNWTITWYTFTSSNGSSSGSSSTGSNVTITFYYWQYGEKTGDTISVPANKPVTITYSCNYTDTNSPQWWLTSGYNWQGQSLTKTAVSGQTNTYTITITPTADTSISFCGSASNTTAKYISNSSAVTWTKNTSDPVAAVTSKIPSSSTTNTVWSVDTSKTESAVTGKIPSATVTNYAVATSTEDALTSMIPTKTVSQAVQVPDSVSTDSMVLDKLSQGAGEFINGTVTYKLPKTGGIGTTLFTSGGVILIMISLLSGFCLRRSRERRIQ